MLVLEDALAVAQREAGALRARVRTAEQAQGDAQRELQELRRQVAARPGSGRGRLGARGERGGGVRRRHLRLPRAWPPQPPPTSSLAKHPTAPSARRFPHGASWNPHGPPVGKVLEPSFPEGAHRARVHPPNVAHTP